MKQSIKEWLMQVPAAPGLLACGIRFEDQTVLCRSFSRDFPVVALEQAWRCVADTYRVLNVHRLPGPRLRWVYSHAELHCLRRDDGIMLGLFVGRQADQMDAAELDRLVAGFSALPTAPHRS